MEQHFLVECPAVLREGLLANRGALDSFQSLDFFRQRSISNYVANASSESDRSQRVNEVLATLLEQAGFSRV